MSEEKSPRHQAADLISAAIIKQKLNKPFGGSVILTESNPRHYRVGFSLSSGNDGVVHVYDTDYVVVRYSHGKRSGESVFVSPKDALKFIKLGFIEGKWDEADKIKQRDT